MQGLARSGFELLVLAQSPRPCFVSSSVIRNLSKTSILPSSRGTSSVIDHATLAAILLRPKMKVRRLTRYGTLRPGDSSNPSDAVFGGLVRAVEPFRSGKGSSRYAAPESMYNGDSTTNLLYALTMTVATGRYIVAEVRTLRAVVTNESRNKHLIRLAPVATKGTLRG